MNPETIIEQNTVLLLPPPMESCQEIAVGKPLKRNSNDLGWEYGELVDLTNKDKVKCLLCGKVCSGGIYRIKCHIAHIGEVAKCKKASDEDIQKCKSMIEAAEDKKKQPKKSRKRKRSGTSSSQEKNSETQDLVKKLVEENEKLVKKNERLWELFDKAYEDNKKLTDENKNLQEVVLQQRELISELGKKLEKEK